MSAPSWVAGSEGHGFGVHTLALGAARFPGESSNRLVARIADRALLLGPACAALLPELAELTSGTTCNPLLAAGPESWALLRSSLTTWLTDERIRGRVEPHLRPLAGAVMQLPLEVADYVDYYASEHHAANVGRLFRPGSPPLPAAWKHLPIGYHGRAGTVVVSGTPIVRPCGLRLPPGGAAPVFGPSVRLDIEGEVGFVVGVPSRLGWPVGLDDFEEHVFGLVLLNDWSARDIQAFEYVPLGPFLSKSFCTSISPWIVPFAAFAAARVAPPRRDVPLAAYLDDSGLPPGGLDITLEVAVQGQVVSRPRFSAMYWTPAQLVAHLTANGASIRAGDLIASGTVSGPEPGEVGSLLELSAGGTLPFTLAAGGRRTFLEDGDEVRISGSVPATDGRPAISLGDVAGRVLPAI